MEKTFKLETPVFQGPLETLLDLIESRKLSISEVSLAEVCDLYLAHIEHLPELPLAQTSQFILVASTLLLIKSRTLLPSLELSSDEKESVEELERRLAQYALVRKAAKILNGEWGVRPLLIAENAPVRPSVFSPGEASIGTLSTAIQRLLQTLPPSLTLGQAVVAPVIALEDVIRSVHTRLSSALRARFSDLTKSADRYEVIVHFLAILELVRSGSASVTQDKLFSDITIELENLGAPRYG